MKHIPKNGVGKRPASQWYWSDWLRDPSVRASSLEARGLWMDMLALMHDGRPYGHLTVGGEAITETQLARMVGESPARIKKLLAELEKNEVFSRTEEGTIYSRRMVRDEHIRNVRADAGKLGGNPNLLEGHKDNHQLDALVKQNDKQKPTPSSAVASASATASAFASEQTSTQSESVLTPRDRFLERFYADAKPERRNEVARQLDQLLKPEGARVRNGVTARAKSQEHLNRVLSAVLRGKPPENPDSAIVFVFRKLDDPDKDDAGNVGATEIANARERRDVAKAEAYHRARREAAKPWGEQNPVLLAQFEAEALEATPGTSDFAATTRKAYVLQRICDVIKFPSYREWSRESQAVPA